MIRCQIWVNFSHSSSKASDLSGKAEVVATDESESEILLSIESAVVGRLDLNYLQQGLRFFGQVAIKLQIIQV